MTTTDKLTAALSDAQATRKEIGANWPESGRSENRSPEVTAYLQQLQARGYVWLVGSQTEYSQEELMAAFVRVQEPLNWKLPINRHDITPDDLPLLVAAVAHFTASESWIRKQPNSDLFHLYAPSYYQTVGA